jgi:hypothetical protein
VVATSDYCVVIPCYRLFAIYVRATYLGRMFKEDWTDRASKRRLEKIDHKSLRAAVTSDNKTRPLNQAPAVRSSFGST